jgi:hypothetical protein
VKNLVYVITASSPFDAGDGNDVFAVVSLMQSGHVEVRLLRGAPAAVGDAAVPASAGETLFAVFDLSHQPGPCSY